MIPPIQIDMSDVLSEFNIPKEVGEDMAEAVIKRLTMRFYETWSVIAGRELKSSRNQYLRSLQVISEGKFSGAVILHGDIPNMVESGMGAFDMKEGFSKSDKIKHTKDGGWYLTVPFRFASAGSLGESEAFSGVLPGAVSKAASKLVPTKSEFKGSVRVGETMSRMQIPDGFKESKTRAGVSNLETKRTFEEYVHKTSIYEGLQKSSKTYEGANQSMFNSFRRVSSKSDPNSWIHSGIRARNLAEKALSEFNIGEEIDIEVDNQLSKLGF